MRAGQSATIFCSPTHYFRNRARAGGAVEPHIVDVSASIGIAGANVLYEQAEELPHDADMAMYQAKSRVGGGFAIFDRSPQEPAATELVTENTCR